MLLVALAFASAAPDPQFAKLRERIAVSCKGNAACIERQKEGVRHFLGIMTLYKPPEKKAASCLAGATNNKLTDWPKAATCLREWSKAQRKPL